MDRVAVRLEILKLVHKHSDAKDNVVKEARIYEAYLFEDATTTPLLGDPGPAPIKRGPGRPKKDPAGNSIEPV